MWVGGEKAKVYALVLLDALADAPEAVGHQRRDAHDVGGRAEPAHRQVALVLDGGVAALRRHVLRHRE